MIKLVLTASRAGQSFPLSATSRDVWTWPSRPEPRASLTATVDLLPGPDQSGPALRGPGDAGAALPRGRARACPARPRAGPQQVNLTVDHLQEAPSSQVTSVGAQVSFNGGQTWQQATVQRKGPARFSLAFTGSPSLVTLRVTARDAAGDTITETLPAAYRIAPATGAPPAEPLTGPAAIPARPGPCGPPARSRAQAGRRCFRHVPDAAARDRRRRHGQAGRTDQGH